MKRHEGITALSREHHFGLLFCWKIRQGIKKATVQRMQPYVQYFWDNHLRQHFEDEERFLFVSLQDPLCDQAISEHKHIRRMIEAITVKGTVSKDELGMLADSLDNHIRFEERVLFPHIEKELPEGILRDIGLHLKSSHENPSVDSYADEFWI